MLFYSYIELRVDFNKKQAENGLQWRSSENGIIYWNCSDTELEIETGDMVWFGMTGMDDWHWVNWVEKTYLEKKKNQKHYTFQVF